MRGAAERRSESPYLLTSTKSTNTDANAFFCYARCCGAADRIAAYANAWVFRCMSFCSTKILALLVQKSQILTHLVSVNKIPGAALLGEVGSKVCQYLYFCTRKASTFVPVRQELRCSAGFGSKGVCELLFAQLNRATKPRA